MSEKLLKFLLSELQTVRIICRNPNCNIVTEMPLDGLAGKQPNALLRCPHCNHDWDPTHSGRSQLVAFAQAARELARLNKIVELEFVLPDPNP